MKYPLKMGFEIELLSLWNRKQFQFEFSKLYQSGLSDQKSSDFSKWWIAKDNSVYGPPFHGHEIISPVMTFDQSFDSLFRILGWMNQKSIITNKTCGLHINLSFVDQSIRSSDTLKLSLLYPENRISSLFGRQHNRYCKSILNGMEYQIKKAVDCYREGKSFWAGVLSSPEMLNRIVPYEKYKSINFSKVSNGYFEFRSIGNHGYHRELEKIKISIQSMAESLLKSASNEDQREYISKLDQMYLPIREVLSGKKRTLD